MFSAFSALNRFWIGQTRVAEGVRLVHLGRLREIWS